MSKYITITEKNGWSKWIQLERKNKFACCDCGLIHRMNFRLKEGYIEFKIGRDRKATAAVRRWRKIKIENI